MSKEPVRQKEDLLSRVIPPSAATIIMDLTTTSFVYTPAKEGVVYVSLDKFKHLLSAVIPAGKGRWRVTHANRANASEFVRTPVEIGGSRAVVRPATESFGYTIYFPVLPPSCEVFYSWVCGTKHKKEDVFSAVVLYTCGILDGRIVVGTSFKLPAFISTSGGLARVVPLPASRVAPTSVIPPPLPHVKPKVTKVDKEVPPAKVDTSSPLGVKDEIELQQDREVRRALRKSFRKLHVQYTERWGDPLVELPDGARELVAAYEELQRKFVAKAMSSPSVAMNAATDVNNNNSASADVTSPAKKKHKKRKKPSTPVKAGDEVILATPVKVCALCKQSGLLQQDNSLHMEVCVSCWNGHEHKLRQVAVAAKNAAAAKPK